MKNKLVVIISATMLLATIKFLSENVAIYGSGTNINISIRNLNSIIPFNEGLDFVIEVNKQEMVNENSLKAISDIETPNFNMVINESYVNR